MPKSNVLRFPVLCSKCDDAFFPPPEIKLGDPYFGLCGQCAWMKYALAEKRARVPHKPLTREDYFRMAAIAFAVCVVVVLWGGR